MAAIHGLVLYDSVLFGIGHNVRRWADGLERAYTRNAIALAPINKRANKGRGSLPPGSLKASIHGSVTRVGPKMLQTDISVDVPYATYVIHGTGPVIVAGNPENWRSWMYVPPNPGFGTRTRHQVVRGQEANDFLTAAAGLTAATHPSLRGLEHQTFRQF